MIKPRKKVIGKGRETNSTKSKNKQSKMLCKVLKFRKQMRSRKPNSLWKEYGNENLKTNKKLWMIAKKI
jgi:hypothetical protein